MGGRQQPRAAGALLLLLEVYKLQQGHELLGTSLGKHGAACMGLSWIPGSGAEPPAHRDPRAGSSSTHLVLVTGRDGEDGAAVHLPHEELGHAVGRGTQTGVSNGEDEQ